MIGEDTHVAGSSCDVDLGYVCGSEDCLVSGSETHDTKTNGVGEPGEEERATILSCQQPPHSHDVPMGQILVRVEQLRKGAGGQTSLVVEGNFRKRPETASTFARATSMRV